MQINTKKKTKLQSSIISKEWIIEQAFTILKEKGRVTFTSNNILDVFQTSAISIEHHFDSINQLEKEVIKKALNLLLEYQSKRLTQCAALDSGIGYVAFSVDEHNLFQAIISEKHSDLFKAYGGRHFQMMLMGCLSDPTLKDIPPDKICNFLISLTIYFHGMAILRSFFSPEQIETMNREVTKMVLKLKSDYLEQCQDKAMSGDDKNNNFVGLQ